MAQEGTRLRNERRVKYARSVLDTEVEDRTVNNAKRIQQEQDREHEIAQQNQRLLQRLERIHKKLPKQYDVSHHTEEHPIQGPSNFLQWQREQERIADENRKMKRRIDQAKSLFDSKQLAADATKSRYFSDQLSKADRRIFVKQKCKQMELQSKARRTDTESRYNSSSRTHHRHKRHHQNHEMELRSIEGVHECFPDQFDRRKSYELPRIRGSHKVESKYASPQTSFLTVTTTSKLIRASELLPRLGH